MHVVPQQEPSPRLRAWVEALPGLSARARRLLLEGDTERRYGGRTEGEAGFRVTAALAAMFSQPGRAFSQADFYAALVLRPTAGGTWARGLRAGKGERYLEGKLAEMLDKARAFCAASPPLTNRADAGLEIARARRAVEWHTWRGRAAGSDEKNLVARLRLAERNGGLVHQVSVRQLAELMGCARSTAEASNARLTEQGWLRMLDAAGGRGEGSSWKLLVPEAASNQCAAPGQLPPAGEGGRKCPGNAQAPARDSRALDQVMAHDAFHARAHGTSAARLLSCLTALDGASTADLAEATGLHRTTVRRRLRALLDDHLVEEADNLYYLPRRLESGAGLAPDQRQLKQIARERGTDGLGEARRQRHQAQRKAWKRWLAEQSARIRENRRPHRPPVRLVPEGVVDITTGELDPAWHGWDVSDPYWPIPRDDLRLSGSRPAAQQAA